MNINKVKQLFKENTKKVGKDQYIVPSRKKYHHQWFWDACFHSIIAIHFNKQIAKREILSVLKGQWQNGKLPHIIYRGKGRRKVNWGTKNTSSLTQPPMIAYAVFNYYKKTKDAKFLRKVYYRLDRYYKWLKFYRDPNDTGLVSVIHPWETGEDSLPTWDVVYGLDGKITNSKLKQKKRWLVDEYRNMSFNDYLFIKKDYFNVKSVLFNSVYAKNLECMIEISKILKLNTSFYEKEHEKTKQAIKNKMWDKREHIFYPLHGKNMKKIKIKTCESFMPLFAGVLSKSEAEKLVKKHLLNEKEFWTKYPIPTIAANSKKFNPNKYWRGSTWVNINWFVVKGLKSYGFNKIANQLKKKTINLVDKGFHEFFNPITGKGVGTDDFAWSALVIDL